MMPRFAGFRPLFFSILLTWCGQWEVALSLILHYLQFVHLTTLLFRTSILLFGHESVLKQIDHRLNHVWFRTAQSGPIYLILRNPEFQSDSLTSETWDWKPLMVRLISEACLMSADFWISKIALIVSGKSFSFRGVSEIHLIRHSPFWRNIVLNTNLLLAGVPS